MDININYSKIIAENLTTQITPERLEELKNKGKIERSNIKRRYDTNTLKILFAKRAEEIVYLKQEYQKYYDIEKGIILASIVFDNDEKFVHMLSMGNFDKETLEIFLHLLAFLKNKAANDGLDESDERYINSVNKYAKRLVNQTARYIGLVQPEIIINKINQILSFNPELLESKENKKTRK